MVHTPSKAYRKWSLISDTKKMIFQYIDLDSILGLAFCQLGRLRWPEQRSQLESRDGRHGRQSVNEHVVTSGRRLLNRLASHHAITLNMETSIKYSNIIHWNWKSCLVQCNEISIKIKINVCNKILCTITFKSMRAMCICWDLGFEKVCKKRHLFYISSWKQFQN